MRARMNGSTTWHGQVRYGSTIRDYRYARLGDYRIWPGPNSNTFVATIMQAAQMKAALTPTAVGKDYPYDGRWVGLTTSRTGVRVTLGGYIGVALGYEGVEVNLLGAVAGFDIRRPALKLPGLGRIGMPLYSKVAPPCDGQRRLAPSANVG